MMPALRQADWVAKDRVAAAVEGPCGEVLLTIALQPKHHSRTRGRRWALVPVAKGVRG